MSFTENVILMCPVDDIFEMIKTELDDFEKVDQSIIGNK